MPSEESRFSSRSLSVGILFFGVITAFLVYAFFTRVGTPVPDATRLYNPNGLLGDIIQVEVRNGCGVSGLAKEMTAYLRTVGFDVVESGDHTTFDEERTRVIDRVGNLDAAKQVAMALGIPDSSVTQEIRSDYYLDVSVIIGKDYLTVKPYILE